MPLFLSIVCNPNTLSQIPKWLLLAPIVWIIGVMVVVMIAGLWGLWNQYH